MGKRIYTKPELPEVRGVCIVCNKNQQKRTRGNKYQALCSTCDRKRFVSPERSARLREKQQANLKQLRDLKKPYREIVVLECSACDFVGVDVCQMDVDHIDGDHANNDLSNLMVLCACCHRLKTKREKDYLALSKRKSPTTNLSC